MATFGIMRFLNRLFRFYLNSSIHVALAVCSLVLITIIEFDLIRDWNLIGTIFFATISGYNFIKYFGLAKFHHRSLAGWLKAIQVFSFFCFVALLYFFSFLSFETMIYLGATSLITFFYAIPMLPKDMLLNKDSSLRNISGLKIYVIAIVWAMVTVIVPIKNEGLAINHDAVLSFIQRFLFVIVVMLPFEIRDMKYDSIKLSTIPQQIGVKRTKLIGFSLILLFYGLQFFKDMLQIELLVIYALVTILVILSVLMSNEKRSVFFSSFWVEAIPIIWLAMNLIILG